LDDAVASAAGQGINHFDLCDAASESVRPTATDVTHLTSRNLADLLALSLFRERAFTFERAGFIIE
jgi:hypothetical protein